MGKQKGVLFSGLLVAVLFLGALLVFAGESAAGGGGEGNPIENIEIFWASLYSRGPDGGAHNP